MTPTTEPVKDNLNTSNKPQHHAFDFGFLKRTHASQTLSRPTAMTATKTFAPMTDEAMRHALKRVEPVHTPVAVVVTAPALAPNQAQAPAPVFATAPAPVATSVPVLRTAPTLAPTVQPQKQVQTMQAPMRPPMQPQTPRPVQPNLAVNLSTPFISLATPKPSSAPAAVPVNPSSSMPPVPSESSLKANLPPLLTAAPLKAVEKLTLPPAKPHRFSYRAIACASVLLVALATVGVFALMSQKKEVPIVAAPKPKVELTQLPEASAYKEDADKAWVTVENTINTLNNDPYSATELDSQVLGL
jgi:hypothetical protein